MKRFTPFKGFQCHLRHYAVWLTMPGGGSKQTGLDVFTRHSLHALSHLQVVERTKQNE